MQEIAEQVQSGDTNNESAGEGSAEGSGGEQQESEQQNGELAQGEGTGNGQEPSEQANQEGQGGGAGQPGQPQQGVAGGNNAGGAWNGWTGARGFSPDLADDLSQQLSQALNEADNLLPELTDRGISEEDLDDIRELVQRLQNQEVAGALQDPSLQELNNTLALLEQLESRVESSLKGTDNKVRTDAPETIPDEYREAVANYYRRLSDEPPETQE